MSKYGKAGAKGKGKRLPKHLMRGGIADFDRPKPNSTSSLYIKSTLKNPDQDELVKCVAIKLHNHVKEGHLQKYQCSKKDEIFSEEIHPISDDVIDFTVVPDFEQVFDFINTIFKAERLAPECIVMCLAYLDRLITSTEVRLHETNWRRLVLSSLILASKVWEDQAVWNVDFLSLFPMVSVEDLNALERKFLQVLNYNVGMKASQYAEYYFDLRELSSAKEFESVKPLTADQAARMESRSLGLESQSREPSGGRKRTASLDGSLVDKSKTPLILN